MKKKMFFALSALLLFAACDTKKYSMNSTGRVLDVLIVANHNDLSQSTTALIDSIFVQPQRCLPQPEPRFNMVKVLPSNFDGEKLMQAYRSIIKCDIADDNPDKVLVGYDRWVKPQVYILVSASCEDSLQALLRRHEPQIVQAIYDVEHLRYINLFSGSGSNQAVVKHIEDKFGFTMSIGSAYRWLNDAKDDYVWVQEKLVEKGDKNGDKIVLSNVLVHTTPFESMDQFQRENLLDRLDTMMCHYIQAQAGGYMGIQRDTTICDLLTSKVKHPGSEYCIPTRGHWGLKETAQRMGGPFVAYSILSPDGKTIVDAVGFVYAPRFEKRDFLLKVESICSSVRW